jgi:5,10-methylene-tetrahydrofolate dehydrogenase/methenyl tetrahydrofolate cyclohydrolase
MTKRASTPLFLPCTPKGVIHLLKSAGKKKKKMSQVIKNSR